MRVPLCKTQLPWQNIVGDHTAVHTVLVPQDAVRGISCIAKVGLLYDDATAAIDRGVLNTLLICMVMRRQHLLQDGSYSAIVYHGVEATVTWP